MSEPFKTGLGWHIIQYTDYKFDDVAAENIDNKIKFELVNERTELLYQDWFSSLKAESLLKLDNELQNNSCSFRWRPKWNWLRLMRTSS